MSDRIRRLFRWLAVVLFIILLFSSCNRTMEPYRLDVTRSDFGMMPDGTPVKLYTLTNKKGVKVKIINVGGIVVSIITPDRNGNFRDILLGYETFGEYLVDKYNFGSIVGRFANRDKNSRVYNYTAAPNVNQTTGGHYIRGEDKDFHKIVWDVVEFKEKQKVSLRLKHISTNDKSGFPENLSLVIIYSLNNDNEFAIDYFTSIDKKTVADFTHHFYLNLAGEGDGKILNHEMMIAADSFKVIDSGISYSGDMCCVQETPLDFRKSRKISSTVYNEHDNTKISQGYGHYYVLKNYDGTLRLAAEVYEPKTGRQLEVFTTGTGIQFYSGNYLKGIIGKRNNIYNQYDAFCLEPQHFPNTPRPSNLPSTVAKPGQIHSQSTIYKFTVK